MVGQEIPDTGWIKRSISTQSSAAPHRLGETFVVNVGGV